MKWQAGAQAQECGYRFSYDGKGQLTQALYGEGSNVTLNNNYNIEASYDKMGNIKYLYRRGKNDTGFASIDDLTCSYKGNQLSKVTEGHVTEPTFYGAFNFVDV